VERDGTKVVLDEDEEPVTRHFAVVTGLPGPRIIDVTDPEDPYLVAQVPCSATDVDVRDDGMLAVFATTVCAPALGNAVVSLADPYAPSVLGGARGTAHHLRLHPGGRFLYLSGGDIFDLNDPTSPAKVGSWFQNVTSLGHANLSFSTDGARMYSATQPVYVFDTLDPADPELITSMFAPGMAIIHDTVPTPDRRFLFVSEEATGGCPHGAVGVWDMDDESNPAFIGQVWAGVGPYTNRENDEMGTGEPSGLACSSHMLSMDPGGRSFSIGWYVAGTRVFDIGGLYQGGPAPALALGWGTYGVGVVQKGFVKPQGTRTGSAVQYGALPGYVFSADFELGLYVSKFVDPDTELP
jgi:hypothetical protein